MRARDGNGTWDVRPVQRPEEAAGLLTAGDDIVLGLPIDAVLAQRLRLPTVDPAEFGEMVRIQVEKTLPYPLGRSDERFRDHRARRKRKRRLGNRGA